MLPPQERRPLRARRRHPNRRRRRSFACSPEPPNARIVVAGAAFMPPSARDGSTPSLYGNFSSSIRLPEAETPVYAVDVSVWDRCDAECSPERGYYYHPSRHSAGQPIVAGWAYQFVAQLNFVRESWTAPMDVRAPPARPRRQRGRHKAGEVVPTTTPPVPTKEGPPLVPCSSSMRATIPSSSSKGWRDALARSSSVCERGDASTATRACATRRRTSDALVATGPR